MGPSIASGVLANVCFWPENTCNSVCPVCPGRTDGTSQVSHARRLAIWRSRGILVVSATSGLWNPRPTSWNPKGGAEGVGRTGRTQAPDPNWLRRPALAVLEMDRFVASVPTHARGVPRMAWKPRALLLGSVGFAGDDSNPAALAAIAGSAGGSALRRSTFIPLRANRPRWRWRATAACDLGSMRSSFAPGRATPSPLPSPPGIHEAKHDGGTRSRDLLRSLRPARAKSGGEARPWGRTLAFGRGSVRPDPTRHARDGHAVRGAAGRARC
jgi:hypothetical protein